MPHLNKSRVSDDTSRLHSQTSESSLSNKFYMGQKKYAISMTSFRSRWVVDIILLLSFVVSLFSGVVLWLILPHGVGKLPIFIISRDGWDSMHIGSSLIFALFAFIHLAFNWKFISRGLCDMFVRR